MPHRNITLMKCKAPRPSQDPSNDRRHTPPLAPGTPRSPGLGSSRSASAEERSMVPPSPWWGMGR